MRYILARQGIRNDETNSGLKIFKEFSNDLQGSSTGQVVDDLRVVGHGQHELALPDVSHTHQLHQVTVHLLPHNRILFALVFKGCG